MLQSHSHTCLEAVDDVRLACKVSVDFFINKIFFLIGFTLSWHQSFAGFAG